MVLLTSIFGLGYVMFPLTTLLTSFTLNQSFNVRDYRFLKLHFLDKCWPAKESKTSWLLLSMLSLGVFVPFVKKTEIS